MTSSEKSAPAVVLDNRGLEPPQPMIRILEALDGLPDAATLLAINEREPLFLYPELAARGYRYQTTPHPDGSFHITIDRETPSPSAEPSAQRGATPVAARSAVVIDVREDQRRRKEPFERIMAAIEALSPDQDLVVINSFEPVPLYRVLGRQGFAHFTTEVGPEEWHVRFTPAATGT